MGLEPVAVAARTNTEVWVVNHLSDSVSIVSLSSVAPSAPAPRARGGAQPFERPTAVRYIPHVIRTLLVGDEPRDIVFAGTPQRAFITTAHRGQQRTDPSIANVPARAIRNSPRREFRAPTCGYSIPPISATPWAARRCAS